MPSNFNWANFAQSLGNAYSSQQKSSGGSNAKQAPSTTYTVPSLTSNQNPQLDQYGAQRSQAESQSLDTVADVIGDNAGTFGEGFKYGYYGAKVTLAPFLAYRAAKQTKAVLGMQAKLSDLQAKAYQTAAEDTLRAGHQQVAAVTFQFGQTHASTRVAQANAGVVVGGRGSAAEVMASQEIATEMQVNQMLANSIAQSYGYQRMKTQQKINSLAIRSAQKSISPWSAAITGLILESSKAASKFSPQMGSAAGSASGGTSGASGNTGGAKAAAGASK